MLPYYIKKPDRPKSQALGLLRIAYNYWRISNTQPHEPWAIVKMGRSLLVTKRFGALGGEMFTIATCNRGKTLRPVLYIGLLLTPAFGKSWDATSQGALANDTLDDQPNLQKVIALAQGGDTVNFSSGKFFLTKPLVPKNGQVLLGPVNGSGTLAYNGVTAASMVALNGLQNIEIGYLAFLGGNTILHASTWGMQMQGDSGGAHNQYLYGNHFASTPKNHSQAIYQNQGHALRFNANIAHIVIDSNFISDFGGGAFQWIGNVEGFTATRNTLAGTIAELPAKGYSNAFPPLANITGPSFGIVGQSLRFSAATSTTKPTQVLWDFDDGIPAQETEAQHIFSKPGTYRITLIVWDSANRAGRADMLVNITKSGSLLHKKPESFIPKPFARLGFYRSSLSASGYRYQKDGKIFDLGGSRKKDDRGAR
jgi:hypothetical protein